MHTLPRTMDLPCLLPSTYSIPKVPHCLWVLAISYYLTTQKVATKFLLVTMQVIVPE